MLFDDQLMECIDKEILQPILSGFQNDGLDFKGVLFIGLMLTEDGPKVIEFNNRFGDPETQAVLVRLESDLLEIFQSVCDNRLAQQNIRWSDSRSVCVVAASGGYPGSYQKGKFISGLDDVEDDIIVFHAGTTKNEAGEIVTSGGRVLGVTVLGDDNDQARKKAFANVKKISFDGMQYRQDIGRILK